MDNRRGMVVVADRGRFYRSEGGIREPNLGRTVILNRSRSGKGRVRRLMISGSTGTVGANGRKTYTFTSKVGGGGIPDGCDPNSGFPDPPPPDPPEPEPEPPKPEPEPDNPEPEPEPEPDDPEQPDGCNPESSAQWYPSAFPDGRGCPPSTYFRGFFERGDGSFLVMCEGESRPDSGECPRNRWTCSNGKCVQVKENGEFETFEECKDSQCGKPRFTCVDGTCVESPNGSFTTIEECQGNCGRFRCEDGTCVPDENGTFENRQACESECGQLPLACVKYDYGFIQGGIYYPLAVVES